MQPQLRRVHRLSWWILAVALPLAFFSAIFLLQAPVWAGQLASLPPPDAPLAPAGEAGNYVLLSRQASPDGGFQLQVRVQQPLTTIAALVYLEDSSRRQFLLGKLGSRHTYTFAVDSTLAAGGPFKVVVIDPLKNQTVQTLKLP